MARWWAHGAEAFLSDGFGGFQAAPRAGTKHSRCGCASARCIKLCRSARLPYTGLLTAAIAVSLLEAADVPSHATALVELCCFYKTYQQL